MSKELQGLLTALVTPFDEDDELDVPMLRRIVDRSVAGGVDGLVAAGSTGEVGALTVDERLQLVETVVEQAAGRVPVIAQTGATSTRLAKQLTRAAEKAGADVVMLVTPYYEALSPEETVGYLKDVAGCVDLPVMLYNIPSATGVNLDPGTVRELATEVGNIRYIKDSSADWEQALRLIHHNSDVIDTFIGWDVYAYSALAEGAAGVLAGTANVVPEELSEVCTQIEQGDLRGALELWKRLYPVIDAMISAPFIAAVKAGMEILGVPAGRPRTPVSELAGAERDRLETALRALRPPTDAQWGEGP